MPGAKATRGAQTSSLIPKENAKFSVMDAQWNPAKTTMLTHDPDTHKLLFWLLNVHTCPSGEISLTWLTNATKQWQELHAISWNTADGIALTPKIGARRIG